MFEITESQSTSSDITVSAIDADFPVSENALSTTELSITAGFILVSSSGMASWAGGDPVATLSGDDLSISTLHFTHVHPIEERGKIHA